MSGTSRFGGSGERRAALVVSASAMFVLAGCDAGSSPQPSSPRLEPPRLEPEPPPPDAISGILVGERDVEEEVLRNYVLPGTSVLIVPVAAEPDL